MISLSFPERQPVAMKTSSGSFGQAPLEQE